MFYVKMLLQFLTETNLCQIIIKIKLSSQFRLFFKLQPAFISLKFIRRWIFFYTFCTSVAFFAALKPCAIVIIILLLSS